MSASSTSLGRYEVMIHRVVQESPSVITLYFEQPSGFLYAAGQYITVFFDDTDISEGKAYSLSSQPDDLDLSITVKKVGLFSGRLHGMRAGDTLCISSAYGMFNAFSDAPLVALAAGVGIAPIYSIIRHDVLHGSNRPIQLIYTNTIDNEIVFKKELDRLMHYADGLGVRYIVTRQNDSEYAGPRMNGTDIAREFPDRMVCICGTVDFVRDMRRQLVVAGVREEDIMTEVFFETKGVVS
ncbi:MAG TPA: FAD-binding oxidoreductase [Candidatus Saccharibacteria bacterium]|nr:FAD-binding oxidoreductase [Candidatus Saccharibacteria bacterium]